MPSCCLLPARNTSSAEARLNGEWSRHRIELAFGTLGLRLSTQNNTIQSDSPLLLPGEIFNLSSSSMNTRPMNFDPGS